MDNNLYYIPKYLDEPPRWLFWTLDEAIALLTPLLLGLIVFDHIVLGFILGVFFMIMIKKMKGSQHQSSLLGHLYWYLPFGEWYLKATPPSYVREYLG